MCEIKNNKKVYPNFGKEDEVGGEKKLTNVLFDPENL